MNKNTTMHNKSTAMGPKNADILLVNPPFCQARSPYSAIPVLAAYLKSNAINCIALDLNLEVYHRLLTRKNILAGVNFAEERFIELNGRPGLSIAEMYQYRILLLTLLERQAPKYDKGDISILAEDFSLIQDSGGADLLTTLATLPHYPDMIITKPYFQKTAMVDAFSSADILGQVEQESFYTGLYKKCIEEKLAVRTPAIVGFSVTFEEQFLPALQCAGIIKSFLPECHITMGGAFVSTFLRKIKALRLFDLVDSLIVDDGEIPLKKLLGVLRRPGRDIGTVPGLIRRCPESGQILFNPPSPVPATKDFVYPDYTVLELDRYLNKKENLYLPFRFSRGCLWGRCAFCRTDLPMIKHYRQPDFDISYRQFKSAIEETGVRTWQFSDESSDPKFLTYLAENLKQDNIRIKWMGHTRVGKQLTCARAKLYRESGCVQLVIGVETLNDRILGLMRKGISTKLIEQVIRQVSGIIPMSAYMIVGFPTETEAEALESYEKLQFYQELGLIRGYFYSLLNIPLGSDIYKNPGKYGITEMPVDADRDLSPNIYDFKAQGMSRKTAYQLLIRFNSARTPNIFKTTRVRVAGKDLGINYQLTEINRILSKRWDCLTMPIGRWLSRPCSLSVKAEKRDKDA